MPSNLRTAIDVPDEMVEMLDRVGGLEKRPRAALIREAIGEFLGGNPFRRRKPPSGFGSTAGRAG
jgi:predicted transcriptional regulator